MSDLRFALRQLLKSGGFAFIAVVTLALGIGLNTSMFSLMKLLILQPVAYPDRDHLARIYRTTPQTQSAASSAGDYLDLRRETADFLDLAAFRMWGYTLSEPGRTPENLNALRVSSNFFTSLRMPPQLGRVFTPDEDQPGNHVIILSHDTWLAHFGGDPAVINRVVQIDGEATTIVGVMPKEFSSLFLWGPGDAFRPLALTDAEKANRDDAGLQLLGRFGPDLSLAQLNTRLLTVAKRLAELRKRELSDDGIRAITLQSAAVTPQTRFISWMMLALAGFVLLIVCGNLANLQLARAVAHFREYAIRAALGASRGRLLRPLLFESVLLSLIGGILGIIVTLWSNDWITHRLTANLPVRIELTVDWQVLTFALGVSVATGVVFGLMPAWLISRVRVNETLKSGTRGSTGDVSQHRLRNFLIIAQCAGALLLLASAGFFIRGLNQLLLRDPHWTPAGIAQCVLNLPPARYPAPEQTYGFYAQLRERLQALPGTESTAVGWTLPIYQFLVTRNFVVEGRDPPPAGHEPLAAVNGVSPGFLDTLKIKLTRGRAFAESDNLRAPHVIVINESMASALFPHEDPVGRRIGGTDPNNRNWQEIVGVFADVGLAANAASQPTPFQAFVPLAQETWNYVTVSLRSSHPGAMLEPMRRAIGELDPNIPVQMLHTADEMIAIGTQGMQVISTLLAAFGFLGLFLAALGLYGVIARLVAQRTPEIGIRLALGAQRLDVVWLVLQSGLRLAVIGAGVGLVLSMLFGLALRAALSGLSGLDFPTMGVVTLLLLVVAGLSSYLPARRAMKVDPLVALRAE